MHICYNCSDKGHLSCTCLKSWKQIIQLTASAKVDIKGIVAEAVMGEMDARDVSKKAQKTKELGKANEEFQAGQQ